MWRKSYDIILNHLHLSGLYDAASELRVGLVGDGEYELDERARDPKVKVVAKGPSERYERETLEHMRQAADTEDVAYVYFHTKGIRHFGTPREAEILEWIDKMLGSNSLHWHDAYNVLVQGRASTYGCLLRFNNHYSGNFWWATSKHIRRLPRRIGPSYTDPETWLFHTLQPFVAANSLNYYDTSQTEHVLRYKVMVHNYFMLGLLLLIIGLVLLFLASFLRFPKGTKGTQASP